MKRLLLTTYITLSCSILFAQGNYYNSLDSNKRCQALKDALYLLTSTNAASFTYDRAFNFLGDVDRISIDGVSYIWDIYSFKSVGTQAYTYKPGDKCTNETGGGSEGICWNREHIFPQSWFGGVVTPMHTDFHNLLPADGYVNTMRSNNPHAKVNVATFTSKNGSKLGSSATTGVSGTVFEPLDEYKGDIARILLFMSVRYADKFSTWTNSDFGRVKGTDKLMGYKKEYLDMLIQWHEQDPPSPKEIGRNNEIQKLQDNRNPFVDFPQFVTYIWKTENCTAVGVKNYQQVATNIYPNPANKEIFVDHTLAKGQNFFITDISGQRIRTGFMNFPSISVSELNNGTYFLFIEESGQTSYSKFIIAR